MYIEPLHSFLIVKPIEKEGVFCMLGDKETVVADVLAIGPGEEKHGEVESSPKYISVGDRILCDFVKTYDIAGEKVVACRYQDVVGIVREE